MWLRGNDLFTSGENVLTIDRGTLTATVVAVIVAGGMQLAAGVAWADEVLSSSSNGVTYVRTETGRTFCGIEGGSVNCTVQFVNPPLTGSGDVANSVTLDQDGTVTFVAADLGVAEPVHTVFYNRTYVANGWIVEAFSDGTRFTSNHTNEGFWVSVDGADALGQM